MDPLYHVIHTFLPPTGACVQCAHTTTALIMGKKKQVRKFGEVKRLLNPNDNRLYVV